MEPLLEDISPELKLLLVAANPGHFLPQTKWSKLDWQRVEDLANWHQIQALLYRETRNQSEVSGAFLQRMRDDATSKTVGNLMLMKESARLMDQIQEEGAEAFLMKGALWATLYYEEIGLREFGDIDFFVNKPDVPKSITAMEKSGYVADRYRAYLLDNPARSDLYFATDYQLPLEAKIPQLIKSVELQWRVAYPRFAFSLEWSELMDRPEEYKIGGMTMRVPRAENQFLLMIVHHVGIEEVDKLKYGIDLVMLLRKVGTRLDWEYVFSKSREKGFCRMVTMGLQIAQLLDARITLPAAVQLEIDKVDNREFIKSTLQHWEDTRAKPMTKSWQIVLHQLKYRDRRADKGRILRAHASYATQFNLLYHKARWYLK